MSSPERHLSLERKMQDLRSAGFETFVIERDDRYHLLFLFCKEKKLYLK